MKTTVFPFAPVLGLLFCAQRALAQDAPPPPTEAAIVTPPAAGPPAPTPTGADDVRAQELYDNGVLLYDEGRYEDAIVAFQEAYRLAKKPLLLYNIANAEERLGQYHEAIDHLNHYRAYAGVDERTALDRRIYNLERRLDEREIVSVSAPPSAPAPAPAPTAAALSMPLATAPAPPPAPGFLPPGGRRRPPVAAIALYSLGGLGLATGGTLGGLALSARGDAGDLCAPAGGPTRCPGSARTAIAHDHTYSLGADIGWGVGVAGAIGGTVALAAQPGAARQAAPDGPVRSDGAFVRVTGVF